MRPRLLPMLLAGVLLPAGLVGCGIPQETDVQVDGRLGQTAESGALSSAAQPPGPMASTEPKEFIRNYLSAVAGDREQAYNRVRQYIEPQARGWLEGRRGSDLYVIRLREQPEATPLDPNGTVTVTVKVQQLGVLRTDGSLAPPAPGGPDEYKFVLRQAGEGESGWRITDDSPKLLLLSDDALDWYYVPQTIYFWNSEQTRLVPDQRYLPKALPVERQLTEVVRWLTAGPQDWLASGVPRPDQITLINNATGSDGRWEVNLRSGADDNRLARLATQLAWSVPEQVTGELDLKIQDQSRIVVDIAEEKSAHPKYPLDGNPERFCIYEGAIHPLSLTDEPSRSVPVDATRNQNLVTAALTRSDGKILAALVATRPDHRQQLKVGAGPSPVKDVNGDKKSFKGMSRPTWLRSLDPQHPYGLIAADGDLYRFDGSGNLTQVPLGDAAGNVTAVAASVEGHRVALVINGALYVAVVSTDGGGVSLGQPRRLVTTLTDITAVDWYAENKLVFAGSEPRGGTREGRPAINGTTIDGAVETPHEADMGVRVTNLSAYPGPGMAGVPSLSYMYEAANKVAYRNNPPGTSIGREQVQDVASPPAGTKVANPTAPFFLY